jgi:mannose-6-phosphate isomerase
MLYPFIFHPIFHERVWGGRNLERLYQKPLPPQVPIGESWEVSDRPESVSVIANGEMAGQTLRSLMTDHAVALLGKEVPPGTPFPLLIKILDAQERLSLQVHPPASIAATLGGEPKTEMWYLAEAAPGAELFVGLKRQVTRAEFEQRLRQGTVEQCVQRLPVKAGDALFLPSGRLHAIGAGTVIFEIQQNSDTTFRVFDWNRLGLDKKPRTLHIEESLASIDFEDHEPILLQGRYSRSSVIKIRLLVQDPLFNVDACQVKRGQRFYLRSAILQVLAILKGRLRIIHQDRELALKAGQVCLLPASLDRVTVVADTQIEFLHVQLGDV